MRDISHKWCITASDECPALAPGVLVSILLGTNASLKPPRNRVEWLQQGDTNEFEQ
jgi:hypothetical protein